MVRDHDVGEDEPSAGSEQVCDVVKQHGLARGVEVVDGERGDGEVERAVGKRVLDGSDVESGVAACQCAARGGEHAGTRVDSVEARLPIGR